MKTKKKLGSVKGSKRAICNSKELLIGSKEHKRYRKTLKMQLPQTQGPEYIQQKYLQIEMTIFHELRELMSFEVITAKAAGNYVS